MIGIQGSGKTMLTQIAFPNHRHISLDKIKEFSSRKKHDLLKQYTISNAQLLHDQRLSKERKIEYVIIDNCLKNGKNVVVDDTNVTKHIRKHHIHLAQKYDATVNAIFFQNIQKAYEQNRNRKKPLDKKILDKFHSDLEIPHMEEGFGFIQVMC